LPLGHLATHLNSTRAPCWPDGDLFKCPRVTKLLVRGSHGGMCLSRWTILASLCLQALCFRHLPLYRKSSSLGDFQRLMKSRRKRCNGKVLCRLVLERAPSGKRADATTTLPYLDVTRSQGILRSYVDVACPFWRAILFCGGGRRVHRVRPRGFPSGQPVSGYLAAAKYFLGRRMSPIICLHSSKARKMPVCCSTIEARCRVPR
jgi:hypothetical protein